MPSDEQHISQAKHNLKFLSTFCDTYDFNDWSITLAFYVAVHIVECAIYRTDPIRFSDREFHAQHSDDLLRFIKMDPTLALENIGELRQHGVRKIVVAKNFEDITTSYLLLHDKSRAARYWQYRWIDSQVQWILKTGLANIIKWANETLKTTFDIEFIERSKLGP